MLHKIYKKILVSLVFFSLTLYCDNWHCDLISVADLMRSNQQIKYLKCWDEVPFEYDFLYIPMLKPYMKDSLALWGINTEKIIEASNDYNIEADELIVPSLVASVRTNGCPRLVHYIPEDILLYIRHKLLRATEQQ